MKTGRAQLKDWIERREVNQIEASRIIGIDPTQLSQILTGKRRPGLDNAVRIEQATGIVVEAWVPLSDGTPAPVAVVATASHSMASRKR